MNLELILIFCAFCTVLGLSLMYFIPLPTPEPILEMDYDPEEVCIVCGKKCDDYGHWTQGG